MSEHHPAPRQKKPVRKAADNIPGLNSCSAQACTGLIPAGLDNEAELEAYQELYSFLPEPPED